MASVSCSAPLVSAINRQERREFLSSVGLFAGYWLNYAIPAAGPAWLIREEPLIRAAVAVLSNGEPYGRQ
jgi:hypothetical protein